MPCILRTIHSSKHYHEVPHCTRSTADNPGLVAKSSGDAAVIALMVIFFALLSTAIVLIAVFCSKRSLDKDCERSDNIQLAHIPTRGYVEAPSTGSGKWTASTNSTIDEIEQRRSGVSTIRGRRGLSELSVTCPEPYEIGMPRKPLAAHRSGPAVFPGVKYGMGQMGNDGRVHRPESIFEHLHP